MASQYKGHHKRDAQGNVLSRAEETRNYRLKYPGRRKKWDKTYRDSEAGHRTHTTYNASEKGRLKTLDSGLKWRYGKGLDDKIAQYEKQHGLCGVCGLALSINLDECHWDHNHETGSMRDLLHPRCNIAVGFIESELYQSVLDYLQRHSNVQS